MHRIKEIHDHDYHRCYNGIQINVFITSLKIVKLRHNTDNVDNNGDNNYRKIGEISLIARMCSCSTVVSSLVLDCYRYR